jgi:hypothetical protein
MARRKNEYSTVIAVRKMKDIRLPIGSVFLTVGTCIFAFGLFIGTKNYEFVNSAQKTSATVIRLDVVHDSTSREDLYRPVFAFSLDGRTIEFPSQSSSRPAGFQEGETVDILYNPKNPKDAKVNSFDALWLGVIVALFLGLVSSLLGGFFLQRFFARKGLKKWLASNGKSVSVKISQVRQDTKYSLNGKNPFVIECQWNDENSGKVVTAVSDHLWFNPDISGHAKVGSDIEVLLDPQDPSRNYIKVDHLRKVAA